jgi:hypothetical protein
MTLPESLDQSFEFIQSLNVARSYSLLDKKKVLSGGGMKLLKYWEYRSSKDHDQKEEHGCRRYFFLLGKPNTQFFRAIKVHERDHVILVCEPWPSMAASMSVWKTERTEVFKHSECIPDLHRHMYQPLTITRQPPSALGNPEWGAPQKISQNDILVRFYGFSKGQLFSVTQSHYLTGSSTTLCQVI